MWPNVGLICSRYRYGIVLVPDSWSFVLISLVFIVTGTNYNFNSVQGCGSRIWSIELSLSSDLIDWMRNCILVGMKKIDRVPIH
jgi:hypothetical protein